MAISLGFGVLLVTFIVLLVVPALYMIIEDLRALVGIEDDHGVEPDEGAPPQWSPARVQGATTTAGPTGVPPAE
jgi:hypothetical protein